MPPRVNHLVTDIGDPRQLTSYAVAAQLALLDKDVNQTMVAAGLGVTTAAFSKMLKGEQPFPDNVLRQLDWMMVARLRDHRHAGGLMSHAVRIRGLERNVPLADVPASWTAVALNTSPQTEIDVLKQASILLSTFMAVEQMGRSTRSIVLQHNDTLREIVHQLTLIGGSPPTTRNIDALILLGGLSTYGFDATRDVLENALFNLPLGFRVWRAVTKLVRLSKPSSAERLRPWVKDLLQKAENLRDDSLYPGRSLDLELAISTPIEWSDPSDPSNDWIARVLAARAQNVDATLRERGMAAHALWERGVQSGVDHNALKNDVQELIAGNRPDVASGLLWIRATLDKVIEHKVTICNEWPKIDTDWFAAAMDAVESLDWYDIPTHIKGGTRSLVLHSLLQNAGILRRRALDTIVAGGWVEPVTNVLGRFLDDPRSQPWIRIRALFALGFLQHPSEHVRETLIKACSDAFNNLGNSPQRSQISEMHAALFAVGDCFGATGAETEARDIRGRLAPLLRQIATEARWASKTELNPVTRATAYLLTVLAQPRVEAQQDLSEELLKAMTKAHGQDKITKSLCDWALSFRFSDDGTIRPMFRGPVIRP